MFTRQSKSRIPLAIASMFALFAGVAHAEAVDPHGQWVGRTQVEGQRDADKTTLSLGTIDQQGTSLELDTGRTCRLRDGTYSAQGTDAWSLHFKPESGDNLCERLSQGEVILRVAGPRKLAFEARYPDGKGGQNQRNGVLMRYP